MHMHNDSSQKLHSKFTGWKIKVTVTAGKQLSWSIDYNGERILNPSLMQMNIAGQIEQPGVNPKVIKAKTVKVNSEQIAVVPLKQKSSETNIIS